MRNTKHFLLLSLYTVLFSILIFIGKQILFPTVQKEEDFVEPSISEDFMEFDEDTELYSFSGDTIPQETQDTVEKDLYEAFKKEYEQLQREKVEFYFVPNAFREDIFSSYLPLAEVFLYTGDILQNIEDLGMFLYQYSGDVRGRMKQKNIHLFGVQSLPDDEFMSVLIHEFGHYFDIYSLPRSRFGDESQRFYDIAWDKPTVMKTGLQPGDFVSGYAMTNQYEDFAESYVYYILHNRDFLKKTEGSSLLAKKYDFFQKYVFEHNQFYKEDFSLEEQPKSYYWDITKLWVDIKKFLQYLENSL